MVTGKTFLLMTSAFSLSLLTCIGIVLYSPAESVAEMPTSVRQVVEEAKEFVLKNDTIHMEALIQSARGDGVSLPEAGDGMPLLCFMRMLANQHRSTVPNLYGNMKRFLQVWATTHPNSIGRLYFDLFHSASPILRSDSGPPKNWETLWKRINSELDAIERATRRSGDWYEAFVLTAACGWKLKEKGALAELPPRFVRWQAVVEEGIRRYPTFIGLPTIVADWYQTLELPYSREAWALHVSSLVPQLGREPYTRLIWMFEFRDGRYQFTPPHGANWSHMSEGFESMLKRVPDSQWNLANYLRFARMADDKGVGKRLVEQMKGKPDPDVFSITARWWDIQDWLAGRQPAKPIWQVTFRRSDGLAWSRDGSKLYAGFQGTGVRELRAADGAMGAFFRIDDRSDVVSSVVTSPDGKLLAACQGAEMGEGPTRTTIWNTADGSVVTSFSSGKGPFRSLAFSSDSSSLFAGGGLFAGPSELWFWTHGTEGTALDWGADHKHALSTLAWRPDSKAVVFNCSRGYVTLAENGQESKFFKQIAVPHKGVIHEIEYSPDGQWLAAAVRGGEWVDRLTAKGSLSFFRTSDMKPREDVLAPLTGGLLTLNYSPDGRLIAAGGYDEHVYVLDSATLEPVAWWNANAGIVSKVRWSPDGKHLAVGTWNGLVGVWKVAD